MYDEKRESYLQFNSWTPEALYVGIHQSEQATNNTGPLFTTVKQDLTVNGNVLLVFHTNLCDEKSVLITGNRDKKWLNLSGQILLGN